MEDHLDRMGQMLTDLIRIMGNTNSMVQELRSEMSALNTRVTNLEEKSKKTNDHISQLEQTMDERFYRLDNSFELVRYHQSNLETNVHYLKKIVAR